MYICREYGVLCSITVTGGFACNYGVFCTDVVYYIGWLTPYTEYVSGWLMAIYGDP